MEQSPEERPCTEELARQAGEESAAFDRLFRHTADRLLLYVRLRLGRKLGSQLEAADVLQETYLAAFRSFHTFSEQGPGSFSRWLCRIADNRIRSLAEHHGAAKRTPPGALLRSDSVIDALRREQDGPSTACRNKESHARLLEAVESLAGDERYTILAIYFHGQSQGEVGQVLGKSDRSVRRLLLSAHDKLGACLTELGGTAEP